MVVLVLVLVEEREEEEDEEEEEKQSAFVSVPYSQKHKVIDKMFSNNVLLRCLTIIFPIIFDL